jgi:hypothetical protein
VTRRISVLVLDTGENLNQLRDPPRRKPPAAVQQWLIICDPCLSLGELVQARTRSHYVGHNALVHIAKSAYDIATRYLFHAGAAELLSVA